MNFHQGSFDVLGNVDDFFQAWYTGCYIGRNTCQVKSIQGHLSCRFCDGLSCYCTNHVSGNSQKSEKFAFYLSQGPFKGCFVQMMLSKCSLGREHAFQMSNPQQRSIFAHLKPNCSTASMISLGERSETSEEPE